MSRGERGREGGSGERVGIGHIKDRDFCGW